MASDALKTALYQKWATNNIYTVLEGKFVLPVAEAASDVTGNESPVVVVTAHAPYRMRTATFDVKKDKQPPLIPSPQDTGCFTFLSGVIDVPGPKVNQTGQSFDWQVSGTYTFVQSVRSSPSDGLVLTSFPFPLDTQSETATLGVQVSVGQNPMVAAAGTDVRSGYVQAQGIDFNNPAWKYIAPTYYPGKLFDSSLLNGELPSNQ